MKPLKFGRHTLNFIGRGNDRAVYEGKRVVVKVPINESCANDQELRIYGRSKQSPGVYLPLARCWMMENGWLVMEKVQICVSSKGLPDWVGCVDCAQVGYTKAGKLVAYDYGS